MGEVFVYVGAYLRVQSRMIEVSTSSFVCPSGHKRHRGRFCPDCGSSEFEVSTRERFALTLDEMIDTEMFGEDRLADCNDHMDTGHLFFTPNDTSAGCIARYSGYANQVERVAFPSPDEAHRLSADFSQEYAGIIAALQASAHVESVAVEVGILVWYD